MKQHITTEQWWELSSNADKRLRDWLDTRKYIQYGDKISEFLTIGRMIEFLDESKQQEEWKIEKTTYGERGGWWWSIAGKKQYQRFLCDALWESVKEILENE